MKYLLILVEDALYWIGKSLLTPFVNLINYVMENIGEDERLEIKKKEIKDNE